MLHHSNSHQQRVDRIPPQASLRRLPRSCYTKTRESLFNFSPLPAQLDWGQNSQEGKLTMLKMVDGGVNAASFFLETVSPNRYLILGLWSFTITDLLSTSISKQRLSGFARPHHQNPGETTSQSMASDYHTKAFTWKYTQIS